MKDFPKKLAARLQKRKAESNFRELRAGYPRAADFVSNDYLGFAKSKELQQLKTTVARSYQLAQEGSTGARLLSGNSKIAMDCEKQLAKFYNAGAALLFNSGYDANLGLLSAVPLRGDLVLYDELCHASIIDGLRLSFADNYKFRHNNTAHLERLLERHSAAAYAPADGDSRHIYVVTESVFSMDGDTAPLEEMVRLCRKFGAHLIVDEAHATGVFGRQGRGLCSELKIEKDVFARVYTFGKALGVHGAAVLGCGALIDYLVNYARSFIYTTALPPASVAGISVAHQLLKNNSQAARLRANIHFFNQCAAEIPNKIRSHSAIHCFLVPGNEYAIRAAVALQKKGFDVRAIKSPTVKEGSERLRVCLHAFNTRAQIEELARALHRLFS